jgi:hypothetical protein
MATRRPVRGGRPNACIVAYSRRRSSSATLVEVKATSNASPSVITATIWIAERNDAIAVSSASASAAAGWTEPVPAVPNSARSSEPAGAVAVGTTATVLATPLSPSRGAWLTFM